MAQRQFRSSDTSVWADRFGSGADGALTVASSSSPSPANAGCSGTADATSLTLDAASTFANGDLLLIHQTRGTNAGTWELNKVASGGGTTTLTLVYPLVISYANSGADQAQVMEMKEYTDATINSSVTYTVPAWDQNKGGILGFFATGLVTITGTINADGASAGASNSGASSGAGFRGGNGFFSANQDQGQRDTSSGEGTDADTAENQNNHGNAGGAGTNHFDGSYDAAGGGGGGHFAAGSNGGASGGGGSNPNVGVGGSTAGSSNLVTMVFGGGGGAGGARPTNGNNGGGGGQGGGIVIIIAKRITVTGSVSVIGGSGGRISNSGGGGGAAGSILLMGQVLDIGTNKLSADGGGGTASGGNGGAGGAGSKGRAYALYSGSITGSAASPDFNSALDNTLAELPIEGSYGFFM